MTSKCAKCKELENLKLKYEILERKYNKLLDGDTITKIHFDLDGVNTACGLDFNERFLDVSENIKEVTCKCCKGAFYKLKCEYDRAFIKKKGKE